MTKLRGLPGFAALLLLVWPTWGPAVGSSREAGIRQPHLAVEDTAAARVIVKYREGTVLMRAASAGPAGTAARPLHAAQLGQRLGLVLQDRHVLGPRTQSLSAQGIGAAELAARIATMADVEWAEPVRRKVIQGVVPNDPYYGPNQTTITPAVGQWYLRAPDATVKSSINAIGAWGTTTGSPMVTVAVLDTGVLFNHPDLAGKLYPGYDFISHADTEGDGNGRDSDATDPGDFTTASSSCGASDSSWHGTQTASLVGAATDNGVGMASVGRNVMVLPVRVLGKCGGWDDDIQAGMLWAAGLSSDPVPNSHPAKVINMSLGADGTCSGNYPDVFARLTAAGVTVVVAAGNGVPGQGGIAVTTPANCPGALAVAGVRHLGTKVGYSNLGPEVAIAAPAGNCVNSTGACQYPILTAINAGTTTATTNTYSDSVNYSVGTSFSAPLVAGTVALMLSVDPTLTPDAIRTALQSTARPFPTTGAGAGIAQCTAPDSSRPQDECYCTTSTCGAGMMDAGAAVAAVALTAANGMPPTAAVSASATTPTAGDTITLSSSGSAASGSRSIVGYGWSLVSGGNLASFIGATDGSTATLKTTGAGSVLVQLTVTDSEGATNSKNLLVTVRAGADTGIATATSSSGGGGGGAMSAAWIALLALAAVGLHFSSSGSAGMRRR
jgi:serine protease